MVWWCYAIFKKLVTHTKHVNHLYKTSSLVTDDVIIRTSCNLETILTTYLSSGVELVVLKAVIPVTYKVLLEILLANLKHLK